MRPYPIRSCSSRTQTPSEPASNSWYSDVSAASRRVKTSQARDGCSRSLAGRRCWPWPPARMPARPSSARPWIPCSSPRQSPTRGSLTQYAGRILRTHDSKTTAEIHDYLDENTGVLAAMLAKRAVGCTGHGNCRETR